MSAYQLRILTPEKKLFDDKVVSITVPGENGQLTVLAGHAPMVAVLVKGKMIIRTENETTLEGETGQGVLQMENNVAAVLVHSFQWDSDENEMQNTIEEVRKDDLVL